MTATLKTYRADPYSYAEARTLTEELDVSEPIAITLVRRGYRTPEEARLFLDASEDHGPEEFDSMEEIVGRVLAAVHDGRQITVHGDFDVDGVCATTILVGTLRRLGGRCDWLIPDRLGDGYGLTSKSVESLAARGTSLLITVDCGITSVAEVAEARARGMEVIVTDHHQPGESLPECPILHPTVSGYPFTELCGTAVAWKLAHALGQSTDEPGAAQADLDLVALATVADIVSLTGENRALVRRGLEVARRSRRPGLRALVAAARGDLARLDESDLSFKLAPRINAAGRLYRADAGVELFLTDDEGRAEAIAAELDRANHERRQIEREVQAQAEAAFRDLPAELQDSPGLVLAGRDWHPGVVGIVASRMVEAHWRPTVLISLDEDGSGRGSGRSISGFDLLGALRACDSHLSRYGGHRAAAGLELDAGALEGFRADFAAHAASVLDAGSLTRTERFDAVVGGAGLGLGLAEELEKLRPFGAGNPGVRLLVPSAKVRDHQTMGEGRHSRFSLHSGGNRALAVAFGKPSLGVDEADSVDAAVRLEVNSFNGAIEPRLVLRELYPVSPSVVDGVPLRHACGCGADEWWERVDSEEDADPARDPEPQGAFSPGDRRPVRHSASPAAVLAELVSSGEGVLAVCSDAARRAELALGTAGLSRFGSGGSRVVCGRCPTEEIETALSSGGPGSVVLTDYAGLARVGGGARAFSHVVLVDPPTGPRCMALAGEGPDGGGGYLHPVWGPAESAFALQVLTEQLDLREQVAGIYRALRKGGKLSGEALSTALIGDGAFPRSPELVGRCLRVLDELGLLDRVPAGPVRTLGAVTSQRTELEKSAAYRAYRDRRERSQRFLERHGQH